MRSYMGFLLLAETISCPGLDRAAVLSQLWCNIFLSGISWNQDTKQTFLTKFRLLFAAASTVIFLFIYFFFGGCFNNQLHLFPPWKAQTLTSGTGKKKEKKEENESNRGRFLQRFSNLNKGSRNPDLHWLQIWVSIREPAGSSECWVENQVNELWVGVHHFASQIEFTLGVCLNVPLHNGCMLKHSNY